MNLMLLRGIVIAVLLSALTAATELLDELTVGVFINDVVPTEATAIADLTPATEDGFEAQAGLEVTAPFEDEDGNICVEVISAPFISGIAPDPPYIGYGLYCLGTVYAELVSVVRFENPVAVAQVGDAVPDRIRIILYP